MTVLEASEKLRLQAAALVGLEPIPVEVIIDLEKTAFRLRKHADNLVEYRHELAAISARLEKLQ